MPKFQKTILKPGRYTVLGLDGSRREESITPDRIQTWVASFKQMQERGIKVPAPWGHKLGIKAGKPDDPALADPRNNAGFWENLEYDDKTGVLCGTISVPDNEDAAKIGTTVKEVSPLVQTKWVDGLGNTYPEAVLHIALCTNPVVPDQPNFEPVDDKAMSTAIACSLSGWMGELAPGMIPGGAQYNNAIAGDPNLGGGMTGTVLEAIRSLKAIGLDLPPDTNEVNILERISVAARAYLAAKRQTMGMYGGDIRQEPTPVVMSNTNTKEAAYIKYATDLARKSYHTRIDALLKSKRINEEYKAKHLDPLLNGFQLSLSEDGKPQEGQLDAILCALEAIPAPKPPLFGQAVYPRGFVASNTPAGTVDQGTPPDLEQNVYSGDLDPDEIDKIVDQQFRNSGYYNQVLAKE